MRRFQVLSWSGLLLLVTSFDQGQSTDPTAAPVLDAYCGLQLGGPSVSEATVVDCGCCATHAVGDYASQVELLFGGRPVNSKARAYGNEKGGQVRMWSLGEYIPEVVCVDGKAMCKCADEAGAWSQSEPSCRAGPSCRPPQAPTEWPSKCAEGVSCSARDRALGREGGGKAAVVDNTDLACDAAPSMKGSNISRRVSIGTTGCEDMAPEQCHLFYTKASDGSFKHCEADMTAVRQCPAMTAKEAKKYDDTTQMEAWAVKNAYVPDAWPIEVNDDSIVQAVQKPDVKAFMKQIDNLPEKMGKSYVL